MPQPTPLSFEYGTAVYRRKYNHTFANINGKWTWVLECNAVPGPGPEGGTVLITSDPESPTGSLQECYTEPIYKQIPSGNYTHPQYPLIIVGRKIVKSFKIGISPDVYRILFISSNGNYLNLSENHMWAKILNEMKPLKTSGEVVSNFHVINNALVVKKNDAVLFFYGVAIKQLTTKEMNLYVSNKQ